MNAEWPRTKLSPNVVLQLHAEGRDSSGYIMHYKSHACIPFVGGWGWVVGATKVFHAAALRGLPLPAESVVASVCKLAREANSGMDTSFSEEFRLVRQGRSR